MSRTDAPDSAALGGPLDEQTPLYAIVASVAADHPRDPLPGGGGDLVPEYERREPIRPVEAEPGRSRGDEWIGPRLARGLRWFFEESAGDRAALGQLYPELVGLDAWGSRKAVELASPLPDPRLAARLGRWLCRYAVDTGAVHLGIDLLAATGDAGDRELLSTLALVDDTFGGPAVRALARTQPDAEAAVFAVAKRLRNWGLGPALSALKHTTDPVIKRWMVRDVDSWGLVYYCDLVAKSGDLLGALRDGPVDDKLFDNAGYILKHLCDPHVQTAGIDGYPDAIAALTLYQRLLAERDSTLASLWYATDLAASVRGGTAAKLDWPQGARADLLRRFDEMFADPKWLAVVTAGLADPAPNRRYFASQCAAAVGFDVIGWLIDSLESATPDGGLNWDPVADCDADRLPRLVAAIHRGLEHSEEPEFWHAGHRALYALLPRLVDNPGLGDELIEYALTRDGMLAGKARQLLRRRER